MIFNIINKQLINQTTKLHHATTKSNKKQTMQKLAIKASKTELEKPIQSTLKLAKFAVMLVCDLKSKIKI